MTPTDSEKILWLELAELFFIDTEMLEADFMRVAKLIKASNWDRSKVEETLVQLIAPHAGANVGYLFIPVIGEWSGFDLDDLCKKIERSQKLRKEKPSWYFTLSDWWCRRMLKNLGIDRLLSLL